MKKSFALEGLPCSGKSTFINRLRIEFDNFECIPELYIEIKKGDRPEITREIYANAELEKYKNFSQNNKNTIFDRTFLSTLAFSYAKAKTLNNASDLDFNLNFYKMNIKEVIIPDCIFIFNISSEKSIERRKTLIRDDTLNFWTNKAFLDNFSDFYDSDIFQRITDGKIINIINTQDNTIEETFTQVCNIIREIL